MLIKRQAYTPPQTQLHRQRQLDQRTPSRTPARSARGTLSRLADRTPRGAGAESPWVLCPPMPISTRLTALPPYVFARLDAAQQKLKAEGKDVISLAVGDPDMGAPSFVVDVLKATADDPAHHRYNYGRGRPEFLAAAADFMKRRFGLDADPTRHILTLVGSKEGLAHLPLAVADPGDVMLHPDPCYPVYRNAAAFTGLRAVPVPLRAENGWLLDFGTISRQDARDARLLIMNHPGNPTAAVAPASHYAEAARFAAAHDIVLASDQAYSEIYYDPSDAPVSLWEAPGVDLETTPAIEFHSLSKTFCMTGWRLGFAVGREDILDALTKVKSTHDSGVFTPIQLAGAEALRRYDDPAVIRYRETYRARRDAIVPALRALGLDIHPPRAGFFAWGRVPTGWTSRTFADRCLHEASVVVVPGDAFGAPGEGWFRVALTVDVPRLHEAAARLAKIDWTTRVPAPA